MRIGRDLDLRLDGDGDGDGRRSDEQQWCRSCTSSRASNKRCEDKAKADSGDGGEEKA